MLFRSVRWPELLRVWSAAPGPEAVADRPLPGTGPVVPLGGPSGRATGALLP